MIGTTCTVPFAGELKVPRSVKLVAGVPQVGVTPIAIAVPAAYEELTETSRLPLRGAPGATMTIGFAGETVCPARLPLRSRSDDTAPGSWARAGAENIAAPAPKAPRIRKERKSRQARILICNL